MTPASPLRGRPCRVAFFTTALSGGGAESHLLRVVNHLDRARFEPVLVLGRRGGSYERFLAPDVPIVTSPLPQPKSSAGRLALASPTLARMAASSSPPHVMVGVLDLPSLVMLASALPARTLRGGWPKLVPVVQAPPTILHDGTKGGPAVLAAMRALYPLADAVVSLSHGVVSDLERLSPRIPPKVRVIHNACMDDSLLDVPAEVDAEVPEASRPVLLAAGRLAAQKDYPTLIEAFRLVRERVDAELWVLGEGPDRASVEARIAELGLTPHVRLLGFRSHPAAYMRRATVFVLSSRFEGFGNVIAEAMAAGAPVVSTDCPHGPSEILRGGELGRLAPVGDPRGLANAIVSLLGNEAERARLREAGRKRASDFDARKIANQYGALFEELTG
jgi:glycosyltransferase involved in cell wall biosynthesis